MLSIDLRKVDQYNLIMTMLYKVLIFQDNVYIINIIFFKKEGDETPLPYSSENHRKVFLSLSFSLSLSLSL